MSNLNLNDPYYNTRQFDDLNSECLPLPTMNGDDIHPELMQIDSSSEMIFNTDPNWLPHDDVPLEAPSTF